MQERLIECCDGAIEILYRNKISGNNGNSLKEKGFIPVFDLL